MSRPTRPWFTKVHPPKKYEEPLDPLLQQPKVILYGGIKNGSLQKTRLTPIPAGDQSDSEWETTPPHSPALSENFDLIPAADTSIPPAGPTQSPVIGSPEPASRDPPAPPEDNSDVPFMALPPGVDLSDLDDHNVPFPPTSTPAEFDILLAFDSSETEEERQARLILEYSTMPNPKKLYGMLRDTALEVTYGQRKMLRSITPPLICEQSTYGYDGAQYIPPTSPSPPAPPNTPVEASVDSQDKSVVVPSQAQSATPSEASPDAAAVAPADAPASPIPIIIITPPSESPATPYSPMVETPSTPVNQFQPYIYSPEINSATPPIISLENEVDTRDNNARPKRPSLTRRSRYESTGQWKRADNTER